MAADGSVWDLMTDEKIGAVVGGTVAMGAPVNINNGDTLDQGYWVFEPRGIIDPDCTLIQSDGTTQSPDNGRIYLLTVS